MSAPVILASGSASRAAMLRDAGVPFTVETSRVDEGSIKAAMLAEDAPPRDIADKLAELKAQRVAARHPGALVLGADQVLVCKGRLYDKPVDRAAAASQLHALQGQTHELLSAAVLFEEARPVWRQIGRAQLVMRPLSDAFIQDYLDRVGEAVLGSVGAYHLEGLGAQLFTRVQGDYFSVLGLPLLDVLGVLRSRGVIGA
ncbi:MAG: Maf family nucleotide pyrophosphatase [Pseudomonadota bacterium]